MVNLVDIKTFFKEANDLDAKCAFAWIQAAMEVRGLVTIPGIKPKRKRRSDAGTKRAAAITEKQQSRTGLPDEDRLQ